VIKIASIVEDDPMKHDGLGNDQHLSADRQGDAGTLHNTLMNHEPMSHDYIIMDQNYIQLKSI
jgi:hypothetical protein